MKSRNIFFFLLIAILPIFWISGYVLNNLSWRAYREEQAEKYAYQHIDDSIKTAQFMQRKECREKRFAYQQNNK